MNLKATKPIRVFIDRKYYGNTPISQTDVKYIPENRRESLSWKGCYYTISPNETQIKGYGKSHNSKE